MSRWTQQLHNLTKLPKCRQLNAPSWGANDLVEALKFFFSLEVAHKLAYVFYSLTSEPMRLKGCNSVVCTPSWRECSLIEMFVKTHVNHNTFAACTLSSVCLITTWWSLPSTYVKSLQVALSSSAKLTYSGCGCARCSCTRIISQNLPLVRTVVPIRIACLCWIDCKPPFKVTGVML